MIAASSGTSKDKPPLILIANDQEWTARSLESILEAEGYVVLRAYTGRQAIDRAIAERPDLVVLDRQLPDLDGPSVCRILRDESALGPMLPVIITTAGPAGRTQRLEACEAGAWDFFGQPLDAEIVSFKLRTFLTAKRHADALRRESLIDELTGLYNARGLERRAREVGSEASRQRQPLACVVFSTQEDSLISALESATDMARRIGGTFQRVGRTADVVGRMGPLDFAVVAPATTADGARAMVERITAEAKQQQVDSGHQDGVALRAGYCAVSDYGAGEMDVTEMLQRAQAAMRGVAA
jgi:diguanylate cyclase (GGDEF)-like protein